MEDYISLIKYRLECSNGRLSCNHTHFHVLEVAAKSEEEDWFVRPHGLRYDVSIPQCLKAQTNCLRIFSSS